MRLLLFLPTLLASCGGPPPSAVAPITPTGLHSEVLPPPAASASPFELLTGEQTGVAFTNHLKPENDKKYLYNGSGMAVGDVDGDGRLDLFLTSIDGPNALYRQTGPLVFEDVTPEALAGGDRWAAGASFVDIDGDGDLDLYVANLGAADQLFVQDGGVWTDRASEIGLGFPGASVMPAFADVDLDGDLDLYLLTNRVRHVGEEAPKAQVRLVDGRPTVHPDFVEQYAIIQGHFEEAGQADHFYRNDGGRFVDATAEAGFAGFDMGLSVQWFDADQDGWPDLFVGNDMKSPDHLYMNDGDGTFTDVTKKAFPHTSWFTMGSDAGDLDNDGLLDLLTGDMSSTDHYKSKTTMGPMSNDAWFLRSAVPAQYMRNALLLNSGRKRWREAAFLAGLASTEWTWAVRIADLDADGWQDIFVTNGHARNANDSDIELATKALQSEGKTEEANALGMSLPPLPESNKAFRNKGDLEFEDVSRAWGLDRVGISHGASVCDLDGDGDLDVVVNNLHEPASIYRNPGVAFHRVVVRLAGRTNTAGIGAQLEVTAGGKRQVRQIHFSHGYLTGEPAEAFFGVGSDTIIESLVVRWPSGHVQRFEDLDADRRYTVDEPAGPVAPSPSTPQPEPWFTRLKADETGLDVRHQETRYDDFAREPLLPNALSNLGPGMAVGDLNGDGQDDVVLGGAAGHATRVLLGDGKRFSAVPGPWESDTSREDLAALILDANGDGLRDLILLAGGVEAPSNSPSQQDLLFLNSEEGFQPGVALSGGGAAGGALAAADVDGDGDVDLFVGGRSTPGAWPSAEPSRLLINHGGRFTPEAPPAFAALGPVYGARFADLLGDHRPELAVATEWGAVHVLEWSDGVVDRTADVGLDGYTGWWHGVEAADFDGDGDLDLLATNHGLNSKYQPRPGAPTLLYVEDFDGNGSVDLVEASFDGGTLYPGRGYSCSKTAMPSIESEFTSYDAFARATLAEVYADRLEGAERKEATWLAHTLFRNDGGTFTPMPLPRIAQISSAWGAGIADFDGDGILDVYLAQNWFSPQVETGRMDGGVGQLLRGRGDGTFDALRPDEAGVLDPADAKAVAVTDLDGDARPDLLVARNRLYIGAHRNTAGKPGLAVRLHQDGGNSDGIGSRVRLKLDDGRVLTRDIAAGGGYQSQSPPSALFGLGGATATSLEVRWPDGASTSHSDLPAQGQVVVDRP